MKHNCRETALIRCGGMNLFLYTNTDTNTDLTTDTNADTNTYTNTDTMIL